jgi:integrase
MEAKKATAQRSRVRVERGVYRQPNGKYAVCCMLAGKPRFRTVAGDLDAARRERTLEAHRYFLDKHLLPALGARRVRMISVEDVAELLTSLRAKGCSEKTTASALATLHSIMRFAVRNGWAIDDQVSRLEPDERPHPVRRRQRVLGREEIRRLLAACLPQYRPLIATALYSGLRISELLGLVWDDLDLRLGEIHVLAQLSRAHRDAPARRVPPKTASAIRDVPLVPQLGGVLRGHRRAATFNGGGDWVFGTRHGTPLGHRNVERRALGRAARLAGLEDGDWPPLRFHDLRHTFASHLIVDPGLDVAQVSRILATPVLRPRSTSTRTSSTRPDTRPRSAPGWRRAPSRGCLTRPTQRRPDGSWSRWPAAALLDRNLTSSCRGLRCRAPQPRSWRLPATSDGASRTRTGDLLGAMHQLRRRVNR